MLSRENVRGESNASCRVKRCPCLYFHFWQVHFPRDSKNCPAVVIKSKRCWLLWNPKAYYHLTFMGPCIVNIFHYKFNKMQLYTVYLYLQISVHVSGGTSTHHQERIKQYLQNLVFVTPLLLSAAIVKELQSSSKASMTASGSSNGVTNTRCCRYSCMPSWLWVAVPPETCRAVSRYK
jgi:hypothetical protein